MSIGDIFKSSFLESIKEFSVTDVVLGMVFALAAGLFIFLIYKKTFSGVMYSTGFAMSLIGLPLVTTLVIMAVTSNVVLSLGMVGALSIVRFRSAIKEPMEIVFLFWALAVGIVIGAGMIPLAIIGSVIIGLILLIFAHKKLGKTPYILIVSCDSEATEENVAKLIGSSVDRFLIKAKTVNDAGIELTAEVRVKDGATSFVNRIKEVAGVSNATLVAYNGDYMS